MKKLFVSAALILCLGMTAQAQEKKMWVGGHIGFMNEKVKDGNSETSFTVMPEFGYQLSNHWAIGIRGGYNQTEWKPQTGDKTKITGFRVEPFARYTVLQGKIGGLFVDGVFSYGQDKNRTKVKTDVYGVSVRPGVSLNLSKCMVLTGSVGILGYTHEKTEGVKTNTFGADFNLNDVQLGLAFKF